MKMTVQEIIDGMIQKTGVGPIPYERTCDRLMAGDPTREVTMIATTFMATVDVIRRAAALGAQLIITHEPTWFTGADDTIWLAGDPIYEQKKALIEETGVAIWRFHDHMHFDPDDGIYRGFDLETGWAKYRMPPDPSAGVFPPAMGEHFDGCYQIPPTTLGALAAFLQERFEMPTMRYIGDPDMPVERVSLLPGGGSLGLGSEHMPMRLMRARALDVIVCGDLTEWTLPAYVRDAYQLALCKGIVVLGHERSEEAGMKHLGTWMKSITGDIPVVFVDSGEPFGYFHTQGT